MAHRLLPCLLVVAFAAILAAGLASCGKNDAESGREDFNLVYERAMRAVHAGDWNALRAELTKDARFVLESDLQRLARRLGHAEDGTHERELARQRLGDDADAAIEEGAHGGLAGALRFFVRIEPRAPVPPRKGLKLEKFKAEVLYALPSGTQRLMRMIRLADGWYVSELQL